MALLLCRVSFMLNVIYAECYKNLYVTECRYANYRYAECCSAELFMLYLKIRVFREIKVFVSGTNNQPIHACVYLEK
jgi:hypothetical protein